MKRGHRLNTGDGYIGGALILLVLGVYSRLLHFDFINFDDPIYVSSNLHVMAGLTREGLRWAFTTIEGANWFPLTWISHMADCWLFGVHAGPQHGTNIVLHATGTLLLFLLLKRMTDASGPSALVAFLFGLHPQHVESVAWISERKDVLSAVFWMLTLWSYAYYVSRPKPSAYLLTLLLYCLGFLAKPMVVTLPLVLVLLDFWPLRRYSLATAAPQGFRAQWREMLREKLPFFALAMAMSMTTYMVQQRGGAVRSLVLVPLSTRVGNALIAAVMYIAKTLWPTSLAVYYPTPAELPAWQVIGAGLVLVSITALVMRFLRTRPYLAVGWFWYLITILPVIGIIRVGDQARADRYTYIPMIGLSIMLAWSGADAWRQWRKARLAVGILTGVACAACVSVTWTQIAYWENSVTLFQHAIAVTVNNDFAHDALGNAWRDQVLYDEAISEYRKALAINPHYESALVNLGSLLGRVGRSREAIAPLTEAVRLQPNDALLRNALGLALAIEHRPDQALAQFQEAVRLKPGLADAHLGLGSTLANLGRIDEAIDHFSEALRLKPASTEASRNLQHALSQRDSAVKE
jgi:Flp pilus assembly protein TadD